MKKRNIIVPIAVALLFGICIGNNSQVPAGFTKPEVARASKKFIRKMNSKDFDGCYSQFNKLMKESMSRNRLESIFSSILDGLGAFDTCKSLSLSSVESLGISYAKCVVKCQYANGQATYTLLLDKNLKIGGLYIK